MINNKNTRYFRAKAVDTFQLGIGYNYNITVIQHFTELISYHPFSENGNSYLLKPIGIVRKA